MLKSIRPISLENLFINWFGENGLVPPEIEDLSNIFTEITEVLGKIGAEKNLFSIWGRASSLISSYGITDRQVTELEVFENNSKRLQKVLENYKEQPRFPPPPSSSSANQ